MVPFGFELSHELVAPSPPLLTTATTTYGLVKKDSFACILNRFNRVMIYGILNSERSEFRLEFFFKKLTPKTLSQISRPAHQEANDSNLCTRFWEPHYIDRC